MRHLTAKLTYSASKYQNAILTDDENYNGTRHIKSFFFLYLAIALRACCYTFAAKIENSGLGSDRLHT